ncbi:hypothetical protein BGZ49_008930 [Haplosporangium sp. Z 27]|nr:hypothetical protein BGZ49_008930 [Haplosporangium sp. Z 27]
MSKRLGAKLIFTGLVLLLSSTLSFTHAQTPTLSTQIPSSTSVSLSTPTATTILAPSAFLGIATATGDGVIFYQGGQLNEPTTQYSNELFSLDTTQSWQTSSPAWTNLTAAATAINIGGPRVSGHSATMSSDLSKLYLTAPTGNSSSPFLYVYNVMSKTWSVGNAPSAQAVLWSGRKEAYMLTDPTTNAIWYIGGVSNGIELNEIDKYQNGSWSANIATITASPGPGGSTGSTTAMYQFSSGTSHILDSKIYIFGGFVSTNGSRSYQSFQSIQYIDVSTSTPRIGTQFTLGSIPPPRQDHCSVLTVSKKVIIYGGYDANSQTTFQDIWTLDLVTMTWQQVIPVISGSPRFGHTCNLVGANMIVYAGMFISQKNESGYVKDTQVYDILETNWVRVYTPKNDTSLPTVPQSNPEPSTSADSSKSLGAGALAGIIIGIVIVVACVAGFVMYRKREKRVKTRKAELQKEEYLLSMTSNTQPEDQNSSGTGIGTDSSDRRRRHRSQRNNPYAGSSTRRLNDPTATSSLGVNHYGFSGIESHSGQSGREDDDVTNSEGGVQYLMQQLPDGTIAVQPVYLSHQPFQLKQSPNMAYSESSSLSGIIGTSEGFVAPQPSSVNKYVQSPTSEITTSGYEEHPSEGSQSQHDNDGINNSNYITPPSPTHNTFASPSNLTRVQSTLSSLASRPQSQGRDSLRQATVRQPRN